MSLRPIPDDWYNEAAQVVTDERIRVGDKPVITDIKKVIQAYVNQGQLRKIDDWNYRLSEAQKESIVSIVAKAVKGFTPSAANTWTNLDIIETQASFGRINPTIAKPRSYQDEYDRSIKTSHDTSPDTSVMKSLEDVWGSLIAGVKKTVKDLLGIDLSTLLIIAVIAIIIIKVK